MPSKGQMLRLPCLLWLGPLSLYVPTAAQVTVSLLGPLLFSISLIPCFYAKSILLMLLKLHKYLCILLPPHLPLWDSRAAIMIPQGAPGSLLQPWGDWGILS